MKRALFIGRFQPPHKGHINFIEKISKNFDEVIIGIGSSNKAYTFDNPFTVKEREEMFNESLKIKNYVIVPIPDIHNYREWVKHVEKLVPRFDVVFSGNKIVKNLFENAGYKVVEIKKKEKFSATTIREAMLAGRPWKKYVCSGVAKIIEKIGGVERIKRLYYSSPSIAVDVIIEMDGGLVLIERKNYPYGWAIPGGLVNYGEKVEEAAIREIKEETNLKIKSLKLFGVYSDPKRDPRRHVISLVYITKVDRGKIKAGDDAKNVKIFKFEEIPNKLAFDHRKIIDDYLRRKNEIQKEIGCL